MFKDHVSRKSRASELTERAPCAPAGGQDRGSHGSRSARAGACAPAPARLALPVMREFSPLEILNQRACSGFLMSLWNMTGHLRSLFEKGLKLTAGLIWTAKSGNFIAQYFGKIILSPSSGAVESE